MAIKSLGKKYVSKKADGGTLVAEQDPLLKKTTPVVTPKVPALVATPTVPDATPPLYNAQVFSAELDKYTSFPVNKKTNNIDIPKGPLRTQLPALSQSIKSKQAVMDAYSKKYNLPSMSSADANKALAEANMGDYNTGYLAEVNAMKKYYDKTVVPSSVPDKTWDMTGMDAGSSNKGATLFYGEDTPYDSTHVQKIFPKNTYVAPQKKKNGGGIKGEVEGYAIGGDIQDESTKDTSVRSDYKKGAGWLMRDQMLGSLDAHVGLIDPNIIKSEDYKTKEGATNMNQGAYGVSTISAGLGAGIVDYYVPGLGTGIQEAKNVASDEQDTKLDAKHTASQNKVAGIGKIAATAVTGASQSSGSSGTEAGASDALVGSDTSVNQVTDGKLLTGQAGTDWQNTIGDDEKASVLAKYNSGGYGYAEGGKIVGAGTGKSDSIKAKPEEGSFIVPAENAKLAERIRAKYLGEKTGVATLKKGGGVDVMLSNGEHMFTKDEADMLRAKGIDLDALAPNAESTNMKAEGGEVGDDKNLDIEKIIKDAKAESDVIVARLRKQEALEKDADKKVILKGRIAEATEQMRISEDNLRFSAKDLASMTSGFRLESRRSSQLKKIEGYANDYRRWQKQLKSYDSGEVKPLGEDEMSTSGDAVKVKPKEEVSFVPPKKGDAKTPPPVVPPKTGGARGVRGVGTTALPKEATKQEMEQREMNNLLNPLQTFDRKSGGTEVAPAPDEMQIDQSIVPSDATKPVAEKEKYNPFKSMDVGQGLALAQTALGAQQLLKDGKRPEDEIPADYLATIADAQKESQYGLSPMELQIANRGIEKNRAADTQTIINLSGGSAGTALANIRAASISANDAKNNLSAQSEALRLQKKRYYDNKISEKAGMSKQLFNEKLNAFNINQEAGAALMGAGIQNLIGGSRYQKELEEQKKREAMSNPTFNIS